MILKGRYSRLYECTLNSGVRFKRRHLVKQPYFYGREYGLEQDIWENDRTFMARNTVQNKIFGDITVIPFLKVRCKMGFSVM